MAQMKMNVQIGRQSQRERERERERERFVPGDWETKEAVQCKFRKVVGLGKGREETYNLLPSSACVLARKPS